MHTHLTLQCPFKAVGYIVSKQVVQPAAQIKVKLLLNESDACLIDIMVM